MNLNTSAETLRAVAKVFQLAAILDDRVAQPDKARIAAWAEQVDRHGLDQSDLLDGLQAFYDGPSERPIQVGDLIHHARIIRRDRTEREEADQLAQRRADHDTKVAADDARGLAAAVTFGPTLSTPRLEAARDALQCVTDRESALAAMREFSEAKAEARKPRKVAS